MTFDGVWWQSLSQDEKLAAVQGMLSGYEAGYVDGAAYPPLDPKKHHTIAQINAHEDRFDGAIAHMPRGKFSFGTIIERIDEAYREHPAIVKDWVSGFLDCAMASDEGCEPTAQDYEKRPHP